ncbi:FHA domain-containing protein [Planctomycetota bacterium]|nr:FHA domain-containing protein [Planctomycetota bacterium]
MNITPVKIHILIGPQAGRIFTLQQSPITFGRSIENTICMDLETLSRKHGEFVFADDGWQYINHSNNGTKLNKKRITTQPQPLDEHSSIAVGREKLFEFQVLSHIAVEDMSSIEDFANDDQHEQKKSNSKRFKMYSIIGGIYAAALLLLVIILSSLSTDDTLNQREQITKISATQIRLEITDEYQKQIPDRRQVHALLGEAKEYIALRDSDVNAPFEAMRVLHKAKAYTKDRSFEDPMYNRLLHDLQDEMINRLVEDMDRASTLLISRKYHDAIDMYEKIERYYPANNESKIFKALIHNKAVAIRLKKQK